MKLPLIFFGTILLLIILVRWYKNKPAKETPTKEEPKKEKDEKKGNLWGKVVFIGFWVIVIFLGYLGYNYFAQKPVYKPVDTSVQTQNWQLCWQKVPHEGKSMLRQKCLPAQIQIKTPSFMVISYQFNHKEGCMQGNSTDGRSYNGSWKDRTGWGNWSLTFISGCTAYGWSDDGGKGPKAPTLLERR